MERNLLLKEAGSVVFEEESGLFSFTPDPLMDPSRTGFNRLRRSSMVYETPQLSPGVAVPKKIDEESVNGHTCYVEIDLNMQASDRYFIDKCIQWDNQIKKTKCLQRDPKQPQYVKADPKEKLTAIYVPPTFKNEGTTDVILYLHGHKTAHPGVEASIREYLNYKNKSYFQLREAIKDSGKNIALVAPTLGPKSRYGNLVDKFDVYMDKVMSSFNEYLIRKRNLHGEFKMGRLIIAAHSGGGAPMQAIVRSGQKYAKRIDELWGLDSWYQSANSWIQFAKKNSSKKILGCYSTTEKNNHLSGRTGLILDRNNKDIPENLVVRKANPNNHFGLIIPYFSYLLSDASSAKAPVTQNKPQQKNGNTGTKQTTPPTGVQQPVVNDGNFERKTQELGNHPIVVGKYADKVKENGKVKKVIEVVKETPSVFLPEITRRALGEQGKNWFQNFTRISFLGRELKIDEYKYKGKKIKVEQLVHMEFAKLLKEIEKKFSATYGGPDKNPKKAGDFLLGKPERISGSRKVSSTATFSMHMFGLAIDVNYLRNPFIEKGDISLVNKVLERAGWIMNGNKPTAYFHGMKYDEISKLDKLLEKYFDLMDKPELLKEKIGSSPGGSPWKNKELTEAKKIMDNDLTVIANKLARGKNKDVIKKGGILDLPKEFVEGMISGGCNWGGFYGDMMHFDMRDIGVGKKVDIERKRYMAEKNAEAKRKYLQKQNDGKK